MVTRHPRTAIAAIAGVIVLALSACASTSRQEGAGEYVDNSVITARVKAAIVDDPALKVAEISVETYKGVVQLGGFVHTQDERDRAGAIASRVEGVRSVKNDMRLK